MRSSSWSKMFHWQNMVLFNMSVLFPCLDILSNLPLRTFLAEQSATLAANMSKDTFILLYKSIRAETTDNTATRTKRERSEHHKKSQREHQTRNSAPSQ